MPRGRRRDPGLARGSLSRQRVSQALVEAFRSGNFRGTRFHFGIALERHGEAMREALRDIARSSQGDVHWAAILALARSGDREALRALCLEVLQTAGAHDTAQLPDASDTGDGVELRTLADVMWQLAGSGRQADSETIEYLAREGAPAVRAAAIHMLTRARGADYVPDLRQLLASGQPRKVAYEAFWQMHALGAPAEPTARDMLTSDHWVERKAGVCLLRRWGHLSDVERERALSDEHTAVRHAAGAPVGDV